MSNRRITGHAFHEAGGVDDWRVLFWGAYAYYRTGTFAVGARLVSAIAEVAEAEQHFPDVDLRPEGVTVHTFSRRDGALSERDISLARRISAAAQELGLEPDPSQLQVLGIEDALDPHRRNPHFWFHELDPPRPGRGRVHIDVSIPKDQIEARVEAALAAGGRIADDSQAPDWWSLASPDNHSIDIAAWPDFEDSPADTFGGG